MLRFSWVLETSSWMNFSQKKTIIKVYMHIASKISMVFKDWVMYDHKRKLSAVNYRFLNLFITPERSRILKNGFQMCTRHILGILANFFPTRNDAQVPRTSGWLESWLMSLVEEEEELDCHSSKARVEKAADCTSPKNLRTRSYTTSAISKS